MELYVHTFPVLCQLRVEFRKDDFRPYSLSVYVNDHALSDSKRKNNFSLRWYKYLLQ